MRAYNVSNACLCSPARLKAFGAQQAKAPRAASFPFLTSEPACVTCYSDIDQGPAARAVQAETWRLSIRELISCSYSFMVLFTAPMGPRWDDTYSFTLVAELLASVLGASCVVTIPTAMLDLTRFLETARDEKLVIGLLATKFNVPYASDPLVLATHDLEVKRTWLSRQNARAHPRSWTTLKIHKIMQNWLPSE